MITQIKTNPFGAIETIKKNLIPIQQDQEVQKSTKIGWMKQNSDLQFQIQLMYAELRVYSYCMRIR